MELSEVAQNETSILKAIDHENIVKYLDHFEIETSRNPQQFSKLKLCIVTEFCQVTYSNPKQYLLIVY